MTKSNSPSPITILESQAWSQLASQLRQTRLMGDPQQLPYQNAKMELRTIDTDLVRPLSRYVLHGHIETQRFLHWGFQAEHGLDTLNLEPEEVRILFQLEGENEEWALIPPIVEVSPDESQPLLIDGEHRFFLARELGVPIQVIWIEGVPVQYPVVAKPLAWSDVERFEAVPATFNKRDYRFPTLALMPDVSTFSDVKLTPENYLYFYFRDLSHICNSGIRRSGSR